MTGVDWTEGDRVEDERRDDEGAVGRREEEGAVDVD